jgi:hypothetical protein
VELAEDMRRVALAAVLALGAAACGGTKTVTTTRTVTLPRTVTVTTQASEAAAPPCNGADLTGTFNVEPGSAGAGQISYILRLENTSAHTCFVSGLPKALLIDEQGGALPTNVQPARPGAATAAKIILKPQEAAVATARFSPDVPGGSEQTDGPCEPRAFTFHLTIGDGTLDAPIRPPTPVCERGTLFFSVFTAAG